MKQFIEEKEKYGKEWPKERSKNVAAALFCHMTNFVATHHGWHIDRNLVPSPFFQLELTTNQIKFLNPDARDIQMGALLDQCSIQKTTKKIAKHCVDFVSGIVNSYYAHIMMHIQ